MKTSILTFLLFFSYQFVSAQTADVFSEIPDDKVPKAVIERFESLHPNAESESWRIKGPVYEVKFNHNGRTHYDRFNPSGLFLEERILKDWDKDASEKLKSTKQRTALKYWEVIEFYEAKSSDKKLYYVVQLKSDEGELATRYFDADGGLREVGKSGY